MLAKSKTSAIIMAVILLTSVIVTTKVSISAGWHPSSADTEISDFSTKIASVSISAWGTIALIIVFAIGLFSLSIYDGYESYFGWQGAVRWATLGVIYALLFPAVIALLPPDYKSSFGLYMFSRLVGALILLVPHWLIFKLLPRSFKQDVQEQKTGTPKTGQQLMYSLSWIFGGMGTLMLYMMCVSPDDFLSNSRAFPIGISVGLFSTILGLVPFLISRPPRWAHWLMIANYTFILVMLFLFVF